MIPYGLYNTRLDQEITIIKNDLLRVLAVAPIFLVILLVDATQVRGETLNVSILHYKFITVVNKFNSCMILLNQQLLLDFPITYTRIYNKNAYISEMAKILIHFSRSKACIWQLP